MGAHESPLPGVGGAWETSRQEISDNGSPQATKAPQARAIITPPFLKVFRCVGMRINSPLTNTREQNAFSFKKMQKPSKS
jgi:hypothetical protein